MRASIWIHCFSLTAFCALFGASCQLASPQVGTAVSPGVARADFEMRLNDTDLVKVPVFFPADESGHGLAGPHPAAIFIQGGFVKPSRYEWQAQELARAGYVVALPQHFLDLAFFGVDIGEGARDLLVRPPTSVLSELVDGNRVAVLGHSLGGVVAVKLALTGRFGALVLEASFPDQADVAAVAAWNRPSLVLAAQNDCSAKLDGVKSGWQQLASPTALMVLEGATHYQFTDSQAEDVQRKCEPTASIDETHARITQALTAFLGPALDGQLNADGLTAVQGTTLEVR